MGQKFLSRRNASRSTLPGNPFALPFPLAQLCECRPRSLVDVAGADRADPESQPRRVRQTETSSQRVRLIQKRTRDGLVRRFLQLGFLRGGCERLRPEFEQIQQLGRIERAAPVALGQQYGPRRRRQKLFGFPGGAVADGALELAKPLPGGIVRITIAVTWAVFAFSHAAAARLGRRVRQT